MTDKIQNGEGVEACPFGHPFEAKYPSAVQNCSWAPGPQLCRVMCKCGAEGPKAESSAAAITAWNTCHSLAREPATADVERVALLTKALQRIQDEPLHILPIVTTQRMRNIAGFALLGEDLA